MKIGVYFKLGEEDRYIDCDRAFTDFMEIKGQVKQVLRPVNPDAPIHSIPLDCLLNIVPVPTE